MRDIKKVKVNKNIEVEKEIVNIPLNTEIVRKTSKIPIFLFVFMFVNIFTYIFFLSSTFYYSLSERSLILEQNNLSKNYNLKNTEENINLKKVAKENISYIDKDLDVNLTLK